VDPVGAPLPEELSRALAAYERHLLSERDLSAHTVRAYLGDVTSLLEQAARLGHTELATIDVRTLRS
jgi:integrase/recombinase XerC